MPRQAECFRLHTEIAYVGKTFKASKRRITWKFAFAGDSDENSVVLVHTVNSGKKVVFLNGSQIHEEETMSLSQWQYPFQLEGHLVSVTIEGTGTFSDEEGYNLRVDGRSFRDMRTTTLLEMRSGRLAGGDGDMPDRSGGAWSRGGGYGSYASPEGPAPSAWDTAVEAEPEVPTTSMKAFVGAHAHAPAPRTSLGGSGGSFKGPSGGGGSGDAWDPFTGAAATGGGGGGSAPAPAHRHVAAPAPAAVSGPGASALRPPPTVGHRAPGGSGASGHVPTGGAPAHPTPTPTSVTDDLAGLMLGGSPAKPVPAPGPAYGGGFDDPFGAPAPAPHTGGGGGGGAVDIFAMPITGTPGAFPSHALAGATSAPHTPVPAPAPGVLEGGLINLDNLTEAKASAAPSKAAPSLAQLKATSTPTTTLPKQPVMAFGGGSATGLGLSPLDMYTPAVPSGPGLGGMPMGMGMGMGGPGPVPYGGGGGGYNPYGGGMGVSGPAATGAPYGYPAARAPAPAPADYNPFA